MYMEGFGSHTYLVAMLMKVKVNIAEKSQMHNSRGTCLRMRRLNSVSSVMVGE